MSPSAEKVLNHENTKWGKHEKERIHIVMGLLS